MKPLDHDGTERFKTSISSLSDDVVLTILLKLESDPRHWARLACVCTRLSSLIRHVCWKQRCTQTIPAVATDLFSSSSVASPPSVASWASLHKLAVCCPGLLHAGVLLENSDFGLERELGPDVHHVGSSQHAQPSSSSVTHVQGQVPEGNSEGTPVSVSVSVSGSDSCSWSLYDDLYFDTVYNASETLENGEVPVIETNGSNQSGQFAVNKRKKTRSLRSHLASGVWNLSREQGNKLLASRFREDCLYICDWPGCVHIEEKRNYMLFRGVFKNFKKSRVWRTINDGNRSRIDLNCAYCSCNQTWDLHSAFCLRRVFGYHDDGEPVVRAYVCENGHVSGAWTDWPLYT